MTAKRMSDDAPIEDRLRERGNDPMLAYHSEIPKTWLRDAADRIDALKLEIARMQPASDDYKRMVADANRYLWWVHGMFSNTSEVACVLAPCENPAQVDMAIDAAMDDSDE